MRVLKVIYSKSKVGLLVLTFYFIINWNTDFRFFSWGDIRLIIVLVIGTAILILIGNANLHEKLLERFRFNLFLMSTIVTLLFLMSYQPDEVTYSMIIVLKPYVYGLIIYSIGFNLLIRFITKQPDNSRQKLLTRREKEIYELILLGYNNKEMSEQLFIAETTVKKHVQNILKKLEVDSKEAIVEMNRK